MRLERISKHIDPDRKLSRSQETWDNRWMALAKEISGWSKDRSRRVGCVVVGPNNEIRSTGFNGFPRGVDDDVESRHERPSKYRWTEHAERNAIYNAARVGIPLDGCRMYLPWFPCMDCARAVIQSGITELICVEPDLNDAVWAADFAEVPQLLMEGGVRVRWWKDPCRNT
jgi:dCMP deaminase